MIRGLCILFNDELHFYFYIKCISPGWLRLYLHPVLVTGVRPIPIKMKDAHIESPFVVNPP